MPKDMTEQDMLKPTLTLAGVEMEMAKLDYLGDHSKADDLLVELVKVLTQLYDDYYMRNRPLVWWSAQKQRIRAILEQYEALPNWYE